MNTVTRHNSDDTKLFSRYISTHEQQIFKNYLACSKDLVYKHSKIPKKAPLILESPVYQNIFESLKAIMYS